MTRARNTNTAKEKLPRERFRLVDRGGGQKEQGRGRRGGEEMDTITLAVWLGSMRTGDTEPRVRKIISITLPCNVTVSFYIFSLKFHFLESRWYRRIKALL